MSLSEEERKAIVNLEIEKAENTFVQVGKLMELGYWDTVANRLYYSVFHAATALLINDGHQVNTHKGIIALLGQHYVKTNKLSSADGRLYSDLQSMRNNSDYNCSYDATEEEIFPLVPKVRTFIENVKALI